MNKFQVVHQIGELLAHTADPWRGLANAVKFIAEEAGCAACVLYALNESKKHFLLVAQHGLDATEYTEGRAFPFGYGLSDVVLNSQQAVNLQDQSRLEHPLYGNAHRAMLSVPLIVGGQSIGTLNLLRKIPRKFSQKTVELAKEIVLPLSIFIINAMLARREDERTDAFLGESATTSNAGNANGNAFLQGRFLSPGTASGHAVKLSGVEDLLSVRRIPSPVNATLAAIEEEKQRMVRALEMAQKACQRSVYELSQTLSEADTNIFAMHAMMMDDPTLRQQLLKSIEEGHSITTALGLALRAFTVQYGKIEDPYLRERLYDIKDVLLSIKNAADNLQVSPNGSISVGEEEKGTVTSAKRLILVAKELLPSQLIAQPLKKVSGILCEEGGATSHIAILARALQIPMLIGIPGVMDIVHPSESILIHCSETTTYAGYCYLHPGLKIIRQFAEPLRMTRDQQYFRWNPAKAQPVQHSQLADGTPLRMCANISLLSEMPAMKHYGIREVGLYRTEFMFMIRERVLDEDAQFALFRQIVDAAHGSPVTLRVLDAGGDKSLPYLEAAKEDNPAMGLRGFRFLLKHREDLLMPHLRALLRASAFGNIRILFPMIADLYDVRRARLALEEAKADLKAHGIKYDDKVAMGIMLEIPSACAAIDTILPEVDFVSVGTNDLLQFLFAVDRGNPSVAKWYKQCHPTLLLVIRRLCQIVSRYPGKNLCICGELGGSITALPLLIGCGVRCFSMTPSRVPLLRELAKKYTVKQCEKLLDDVLTNCSTDQEVREYLQNYGTAQ